MCNVIMLAVPLSNALLENTSFTNIVEVKEDSFLRTNRIIRTWFMNGINTDNDLSKVFDAYFDSI